MRWRSVSLPVPCSCLPGIRSLSGSTARERSRAWWTPSTRAFRLDQAPPSRVRSGESAPAERRRHRCRPARHARGIITELRPRLRTLPPSREASGPAESRQAGARARSHPLARAHSLVRQAARSACQTEFHACRHTLPGTVIVTSRPPGDWRIVRGALCRFEGAFARIVASHKRPDAAGQQAGGVLSFSAVD